ncbi:hypothetical protein LQ318_11660 [Aliifodinibius salicampi]|uniref:Uncharacterized protein n=1 Tax=Fodinibius salicampi TaxID=1920655 RepID=A0ABT3Q0B0_9BACT|nr:hypothetical protein [Fodinibius salicampi]MCW9713557.1 hypothetical protein [Fodinibius salicampi]
MSKGKYTFADWKSGQIEKDYANKEIEGFNDQNLYGVGYLPQQLHEQGFITDKEYSKIEKAQKEIFDKSVENAYKSFLNEFLERLENAYKPAEFIQNRINRLQSELDRASNHILEQVYEGNWSKVGIGHKAYAMVNNSDGMGWTYLHNTIQTPADNTRSANHVFVSTVSLYQIEELEKLLKSEYSKSEKDDRRSYGQHQKNRKWIIEKFEEQESKQPSQNKTAIAVKELYKKEFGLNIDKSTVLRYNDRM